MEKCHFVCFSCMEFNNDASFTYDNWKKYERLKKHSASEKHRTSMTKWITFQMNAKKETSVLQQLVTAHKQQVLINRIIIECLIFIAQHNISARGPEEDRKNIGNMSNVNRGNFIELLHLRCQEVSWLSSKLKQQCNGHAQ